MFIYAFENVFLNQFGNERNIGHRTIVFENVCIQIHVGKRRNSELTKESASHPVI